MTDERKTYLIMDDGGTLWSSDEYDAFEEGSRLLGAVDVGDVSAYEEHLGKAWKGDLVFCREIRRTR